MVDCLLCFTDGVMCLAFFTVGEGPTGTLGPFIQSRRRVRSGGPGPLKMAEVYETPDYNSPRTGGRRESVEEEPPLSDTSELARPHPRLNGILCDSEMDLTLS